MLSWAKIFKMNIKDISWEAQLNLDLINPSVKNTISTQKLFRYQFKNSDSPVNQLENITCQYVKAKFALGVSSATNAIFLALKSIGVTANSKVLIPAFTFTAVPSAVVQCGADPVLVDITKEYVIDLNDLESKILSSGAKYLLLSHMRGHLCDMDKIVGICKKYSIDLIEDAAHAFGVKWNGKHAGTFGIAGIYSLQSYKVINAGEGGILVTNNPEIFWKSVFMSGSYEKNYLLHSNHDLNIANQYKNKLPVFNVRMNNITASIAIPQVKVIESTIDKVNRNFNNFKHIISSNSLISFPTELPQIRPVRDSAQFRIAINEKARIELKELLIESGVPISYFGGENNTNARLYKNWKFIKIDETTLPNTMRHLSDAFDIRLPIHFTSRTIEAIAKQILETLSNYN